MTSPTFRLLAAAAVKLYTRPKGMPATGVLTLDEFTAVEDEARRRRRCTHLGNVTWNPAVGHYQCDHCGHIFHRP